MVRNALEGKLPVMESRIDVIECKIHKTAVIEGNVNKTEKSFDQKMGKNRKSKRKSKRNSIIKYCKTFSRERRQIENKIEVNINRKKARIPQNR